MTLAQTCHGSAQVTYEIDCNYPLKYGDFTYTMHFDGPSSKSKRVCTGVGMAPTTARIISWEVA